MNEPKLSNMEQSAAPSGHQAEVASAQGRVSAPPEPSWWAGALNRRATVEQWMFDAARGKRPMPSADELRAWAIKLGTPEPGEPHAVAMPASELPGIAYGTQALGRGFFNAEPACCKNCGGTWSQHDGKGRCPSGVKGAPALDLSEVPVPQQNSWQRPSKEWYEATIARTQEAEDAAGGVLAAGGLVNLPRHKFWGAGEPDCPPELKAPNGELHTMRCKVCGDGWRKTGNVCLPHGVMTCATEQDCEWQPWCRMHGNCRKKVEAERTAKHVAGVPGPDGSKAE